jgi:hypothetical protein
MVGAGDFIVCIGFNRVTGQNEIRIFDYVRGNEVINTMINDQQGNPAQYIIPEWANYHLICTFDRIYYISYSENRIKELK